MNEEEQKIPTIEEMRLSVEALGNSLAELSYIVKTAERLKTTSPTFYEMLKELK